MDTIPEAQDLWDGIGGHFDSLTQIICEFVDNSIANFSANKVENRSINIILHEKTESKVKVVVEDGGTGIKDFQPVLRLGDRSVRESPLNEHGWGLKHALASANPSNDSWKIYTRTEEDIKNGIYRVVSAPYSYNMEQEEIKISSKPWVGRFNNSGTIIEFECGRLLFDTVQRGVRGAAGFEQCLNYLREDLGYIYSGVIKEGKANINIIADGYSEAVAVVEPDWIGFYEPRQGNVDVDLGAGRVKVEYEFGEMEESTHFKRYKRNMSTSGVEVRINGRLLMDNIFKDIWEIENHPSYNHLLVKLNLVSDDRDKLPRTRTSKNGIRSGDEKLEKLFDWIRRTHPTPEKKSSGAVNEKELVDELAKAKRTHIRNTDKRVETEFRVFTNIGSPVPVDLYVYDGNDVVLYEAKREIADVQNLYQLLMYWDGAVSDGLQPSEGILIASDFSAGVDAVLKQINSQMDRNGKKYNFSKTTWRNEGIEYPRT